MPEIGRIQSTNFQSLLTDLGITRNNIPFGLQSEVMPVVLVGGTVTFVAAPTPAYRVQDVFTEGEITAPAALALLADTGPLPQGAYSLKMTINTSTQINSYRVAWRNAANSADLRSITLLGGPESMNLLDVRFQVENDNERFTVRNVGVGDAGQVYQAVLFVRT